MVSLLSPTFTLRPTVDGWWAAIYERCDAFFEATSQFDFDAPGPTIANKLIELEMLRLDVEGAEYPQHAAHARKLLLAAMSHTLDSLHAGLDADAGSMNYLNKKAQEKLYKFSALLGTLMAA